MKKLFTSILTVVLLFSMVGSVFAESKKVNYEYSTALVKAVQLDEKFVGAVGVDGEFLFLDQQKAIENGISTDKIKEAKEKIKDYNKITKDALEITPLLTFVGNQIQFDEIEAEEKGVSKELINATKSDIEKINKASEGIFSIAACDGSNKYVDRWYGYDTYFDSCNANKLIGYLTIGAGITTIAAAITAFIAPPVGLAVGIAAGLIGIGAGALTVANANGCGILIRWSFDKPIWTGSQC
ncbi:hypothetical protein ACH0B5_17850 [Ureibacillus sp. 179-F W5.1 NHS]|uniref:Uncharacterized protein n=1 Tax=Lysinibacillus halotolerans TaxID=1368476 RepID=A0A3M8GYQ2_9BACI|nr:hypothetical protein [Lysinibacillus halotolerans]RNC95385.1 hypothetical protein EC501_18165 [Lysinibacillus halotolerans]